MQNAMDAYRVLDLTDDKGVFCAKILADLGADVLKIEKPGGDPGLRIGPFYKDDPDPEKSLHWFAYNLNKRGITLDIEKEEGRALFKKLVEKADFVIESFPPGTLDGLGLGYEALAAINPRVILTSITAFGQSGPYRDYKGPDIVAIAMGGLAYITGNAGESPVRVSFPQSYLLAAAEAAAATMIAHYHRETTGQGQWIDCSIQASVAGKLSNAVPTWELNRSVLKREGSHMFGRGAKLKMRLLWPCKDGYVTFALMGGKLGAKSNQTVAKWISDAGMAPDFFREIDWPALDIAKQTQEEQDRIEAVVAAFFAKHTKAEIYRRANAEGVLLCPQSSCGDILENEQLQSRDFWVQVEHPELGTSLTYPGAFLKATRTPPTIRRRAPLIGEHNAEVYGGELGLSAEELRTMAAAGVI
jgi:crotonobetainyl-CoA:carnitine CoA-transferase CaiB-like acyl-CoA transferase